MQQQHQHPSQGSLSRPVFLILLSLVDGPKQTVELRESIEQRTSLFIEPGTLYRVLTRLERRGWIEGLDEEGPLRRYRLTALGMLTLEQAEAGSHKEKPREGRRPEVRKGKEIIMLPVLFLVFCMQFEFLVVPDNVNWGDVLIVWLTTGLAGLIIALAVKIGSGESTAFHR